MSVAKSFVKTVGESALSWNLPLSFSYPSQQLSPASLHHLDSLLPVFETCWWSQKCHFNSRPVTKGLLEFCVSYSSSKYGISSLQAWLGKNCLILGLKTPCLKAGAVSVCRVEPPPMSKALKHHTKMKKWCIVNVHTNQICLLVFFFKSVILSSLCSVEHHAGLWPPSNNSTYLNASL